ncbi:MAG: hypothetical protein J0H23_08215 [Micrococcales bacterium]|nr:hypothetical protein [Micrococcales bacterium]OJX67364.1 MAG: hypothetical protein BGO94_00545 [Micrococcales bacterium 72-143]
MSPRRALAASAVLAVALALSGCDDEQRMPVPAGTPSPTPDSAQTEGPEQIDPRCLEVYPDDAVLAYEGYIAVRPLSWPAPPEFAALCWFEVVSEVEAIAYYATTYYTPFTWVMRHYERAFPAGQHGRAPTADGDILTGVLGDASYYIQSTGTSSYLINWALDGQYDYDD